PCGKPRSFFESLEDPKTCDLAKHLGTMAVEKVSQGLSKKQITRALLQELARRASKAELDLTGSPSYGDPKKAKRVVVKFTDFECPHCKKSSQPAKDLAKKYDAVLYIKMFPLESIHDQAREAALAALAAHR